MKTHKKIDIFIKHGSNKWFDYYASTCQAKTCREAKARFLAMHAFRPDRVKAAFAK